ncbi:MAG: hypothetical protein ACJ8MH_12620 [Povalibacter sp.]
MTVPAQERLEMNLLSSGARGLVRVATDDSFVELAELSRARRRIEACLAELPENERERLAAALLEQAIQQALRGATPAGERA